jgi:hypothetical protein
MFPNMLGIPPQKFPIGWVFDEVCGVSGRNGCSAVGCDAVLRSIWLPVDCPLAAPT